MAEQIDLTMTGQARSRTAADREMERDLSRSLIQVVLEASQSGMSDGTPGIASARLPGGSLLITPPESTGADLIADDIIRIGPDGDTEGFSDRLTRELILHRHVYAARHDVRSIMHLDSPAAAALASLRKDIPAFHETVALAGGHSIRCSEYAIFSSGPFIQAVLAALTDRRACLLANHGQLTVASTPAQALMLAKNVESLSGRFLQATAAGKPALLSPHEMDGVLEMFGTAVNSGPS